MSSCTTNLNFKYTVTNRLYNSFVTCSICEVSTRGDQYIHGQHLSRSQYKTHLVYTLPIINSINFELIDNLLYFWRHWLKVMSIILCYSKGIILNQMIPTRTTCTVNGEYYSHVLRVNLSTNMLITPCIWFLFMPSIKSRMPVYTSNICYLRSKDLFYVSLYGFLLLVFCFH